MLDVLSEGWLLLKIVYFHLFSWSGLVMNWNLHRACAVVDICCSAAACLFHSWMNRDSVAQYSIKQEYFCGLFRVSTAQKSIHTWLFNTQKPICNFFSHSFFSVFLKHSATFRSRDIFFSLLYLFKGLLPNPFELRSLAFIDHHPFCIRFSNAMTTLSEKTTNRSIPLSNFLCPQSGTPMCRSYGQ